ncbi:MAG: hypothetical protein ACLPPF_19430 [Rhodomicrobium sp.]
MRRVLIGFGTPLGYYLASRRIFADCFTYKQALNGLSRCDEAVIVVPAAKRLGANSSGPLGRALIAASMQAAGRMVLLSSLDVYSSKGLPLDETAKPSGLRGKSWLPSFERQVLECGAPSQILRLPDVFGPYIAKGAPGCFLDAGTSKINRVAIHQWYPVRRLESDIDTARGVDAPVINLVPEPMPMNAILEKYFPGQIGQVLTPAPYSRIRTRYAAQFGGSGDYIMNAREVLEEIGRYVREMRGSSSGTNSDAVFSAGKFSAATMA